MSRSFPHLADSGFPHADNIDVYRYANDFDYSRYDAVQMRLTLCSVPWDMGEAHVGNRTISGIGNVVYFESKDEREAWFAAIPDDECYRFETKFKELHRNNEIDVPIPFDVASKYNYLVVEYSLFANDGSPVEYEDDTGLKRWFWFVREVEFIAPNSTKLHLMVDAWQTFIYDLDVTGMVLERGHAPMVKTSADYYLENPLERCGDLLSEDAINPNANEVSYAAGEYIFNAGTMKAVIISTANPVSGSWGTKAADTWRCDGRRHFTQDGLPSYCAFALNASSFNTFVDNVQSSYPQFAQTIQAICFVSTDLLTLGSSFIFADVSCNLISSEYKAHDVLKLDVSQFGYSNRYKQIAKLYTYPYAYIELTDERGNITEVRIESTDGNIKVESCLSLVYPWLNIATHLTSTGRGSRRTVSFKGITTRNMPIKGDWYKTITEWNIPVFGTVQDAKVHNDYATHFDREQDATAYTNAYDSSVASANAAKTNAYSSAATSKTNVDNSASAAKLNANDSATTATTIAGLQVTANDANVAANAALIAANSTLDKAVNITNTLNSNAYITATTNADIEAENQRASIAAGANSSHAAVSALTNAVSLNIPGAIGAVADSSIDTAAIYSNAQVTVNQTASQASSQRSFNDGNRTVSNIAIENKADNQTDNIEALRDNNDALTSGSAAAAAALTNGNALRSYNATIANTARDKSTAEGIADLENTTAKANATRTKNTAIAAVDNQIMQSGLDAPLQYSEFANGEHAATRPMGLFANIVTQDRYSIRYAGDTMLRYGYAYNRYWEFDGDWNVCSKFTYWKLSDFWVTNLHIPDMYVDRIRFFLFGGVTVWRKPEDIGVTDIYDNVVWS